MQGKLLSLLPIGPLQLAILVVQTVMLGRKSRTGTEQTKEITIQYYVCLLLVLPQCDFCVPA